MKVNPYRFEETGMNDFEDPLRRKPTARRFVWPSMLVFLALTSIGCNDGSQRRSTATEESAPRSAAVGPDSLERDARQELLTRARRAVGNAWEGGRNWADAVHPDIFQVLVEAGFQRADEVDRADYLPLPPGAAGQVGHFSAGSETVIVARVTYLSEEFAAPHAALIRERMSLLSSANERLVHLGPTVIHIRAGTAAIADQVMQLFEPAQWPQRTLE